MVLEEATPSSSPSTFDDASPTSAFSSNDSSFTPPSTSSSRHYNVDMSQLPKGLPLLGPLTGFNEERRVATIQGTLGAVTKLVRRDLREEEIQAVAYHTSKGLAIASYGFPLGVSGGLWRAYNARGTFRFPFYQPNIDKFNPESLITLRGEMARKGWHVLRAGAYGAVGGWVGRTLVAGYAATVAATGQRMDKRMGDIVDAIGKMSQEERRDRGRNSVRTGVTHGSAVQQQIADVDGKSYGGYSANAAGEITSDTGALSDGFMRGREQRQQATPGSSGVRNTQSTYDIDRVTSQPSVRSESSNSSIFDYDDASPTAPGSAANETAWDRLRKGGPSQTSSPQPQRQHSQGGDDAWSQRRRGGSYGGEQAEQQEGSTLGDSFSFAGGNEQERALEKERAQREFDDRVEKERRGEDFSSAKRW